MINYDKEKTENAAAHEPDTAYAHEKQCVKNLETELHAMTLLNNQYLKEIKALQRMNEYLTIQIRSPQNIANNGFVTGNQKKLENDISKFQNSYSYRLGGILVDGVTKPGKNTLMMPYRIIRLILDFLFKK